jgi:hypothetical protein
MSLRTRIFALPLPGFLRAACIAALARLTAAAFDLSPRRIGCLDDYAAFTAEQAETALTAGNSTAEIEEKLFNGSRHLGSRLRFWLGIRSVQEAMSAARSLYRIVGVDFRAESSGRFVVPRCRFSTCYSPAVCRLISSLDAGIVFGLTGGAGMLFVRRITEGSAFCSGVIQ